MIERWLVAIRDHPNRPPPMQRLVLHSLALRVNWNTGAGFASEKQLAADANASAPTVRRATRWGRDAGYLLRTRRGHRISTDIVAASEWRLTQPVTGDLLEEPTDQNGRANGSIAPTQPISGDRPSSSVSSSSISIGPRAPARAPRGPYKAPPCPSCGQPHAQAELADREFRRLALRSEAICAQCVREFGIR